MTRTLTIRHTMAPWGVVACVAAFVLCELALVVIA